MGFMRRGSGRILTLMLVAFLALLAFLGGFGGKSAKNVECAKGGEMDLDRSRSLRQPYHIVCAPSLFCW